MLGKSFARPTPSATQKQVRFAPVPSEIPPPPRGGAIRIGQGRPRSGATITPPPPRLAPTNFVSDTGKTITIAKTTMGLTGAGLEKVVGGAIDQTLRKRITEYGTQCANAKKPLDPDVVKVATKLANGEGATLLDFRLLSKSIPAVKEVVITGTHTTELEDDGKGKMKKMEGSNQEGQLYVFDADSEPDLEIAVAVHASASFPVAFKPVDIKLSSGMTVRFIDGGVMNNTPTSSSIGNERALDPMPDGRGMTFVFEDKTSKGLLEERVAPSQGKMARLQDWFLSSDNAGAA